MKNTKAKIKTIKINLCASHPMQADLLYSFRKYNLPAMLDDLITYYLCALREDRQLEAIASLIDLVEESRCILQELYAKCEPMDNIQTVVILQAVAKALIELHLKQLGMKLDEFAVRKNSVITGGVSQ